MNKSRRQMLITGSNRGLGAACVSEFCDYDLITVSRNSGAVEVGDLRDRAFLEHLVQTYNPDVLINNAAVWSTDWAAQIDTNIFQSGYLASNFYSKMKAGSQIINVASTSANLVGWPRISDAEIFYMTAKSALKTLSNALSRSKRRPVRVTSFEPAFFVSDFANINQRWEKVKDHIPDNHQWFRQRLMQPSDLAKTIRWILDQPPHIEVASIELLNSIVSE